MTLRDRGIKEVYFHASCPDGTASAMIVSRALTIYGVNEDVKYIPVQYGTRAQEELAPGPGQLFVDITPPISRWKEWKGTGVIVLDHHETSKEAVLGLDGIYGTNDEWCGARLAYKHIYGPSIGLGRESSDFDDFTFVAMIRDTWKKDHPRWSDACDQAQALQFLGHEEILKQVSSGELSIPKIMALGKMLSEKTERTVKKYVRGAYHTNCGVLNVSFVNCTEKVQSEVGNSLIEEGADVAVIWFSMFEDGMTKIGVSLRGNGKVSVRKVAEHFGGGGHDKAAGFNIKNAHNASSRNIEDAVLTGIRLTS